MRKILPLITVAVLAGAAAILLHRNTQLKKDAAIKEQIISDIAVNSSALESLESNLLWSLKSDHWDLSALTICDTTGRDSDLSRVANGKRLLVYRFGETDCQQCVDFGLQKLKEFIQLRPEHVIILGRYSNPTQFKRWCRMASNGIGLCLNANDRLPFDESLMPCYFIIHPDLTIGEFFMPDKSAPQLVAKYFKIIGEKYFVQ